MDNTKEQHECTKKQHEREVGDALIAELNQKQGKQYVFKDRSGDEVPDLIYRDESSQIGLEIESCYYDNDDATFKWQNAKNLPDAPQGWSGVNFNRALVMNINKAIQKKCAKDYGPNCLLGLYIHTGLTTYKKMVSLIPSIKVPLKHKFVGIYLIGYFGVNNDSDTSKAIWELFPDSD